MGLSTRYRTIPRQLPRLLITEKKKKQRVEWRSRRPRRGREGSLIRRF